MAIIEATPITDTQGGLIAFGFAIALLLFRSWLTSPKRRFPRIVIAPPPPVQTVEPHAGRDPGLSRATGGYDDGIVRALARSHRPPAAPPSPYDGRH